MARSYRISSPGKALELFPESADPEEIEQRQHGEVFVTLSEAARSSFEA